MTTPEGMPEISIEELTLVQFGYSHCLDEEVPVFSRPGEAVTGRSFLAAYGDSPHGEDTEDLLNLFQEMEHSDPNYQIVKARIARYLKAQFGDSVFESDGKP